MKAKHGLAVLTAVLIFFGLRYALVPTLAFNFTDIYFLLFVSLAAATVITFKSKPDRGTFVFGAGALLCLIIPAVYAIFGSTVILHTQAYRNIIGKVEEGKFTSDIEPISLNEIRIVDEESAEKIGDKLLGSDPALGSRVEYGNYTLQNVKKHLYWIAPLLHSGFWKWMNNNGTPGYVMVSATDPQDAHLVEKVEGKDVVIKYQPNAYFGDDLERHMRFNGYAGTGLTDYSFEVDDSLHPHWVVSTYDHTIGFGGSNATGVLVVDPETGNINQYTPENAPVWIDRIQPSDFIKNQLNDWGDLVNGYWNWSNKGKLQVTDETLSLVYGSDGLCYFYTGLTSVGKDNGTIGFVLVDSRTKKAKLYMQAGAIESSAQSSAEGKVQQMGYAASYPIMYNIEGIPTYVMSLKDKGGLVKAIAMVNVTDYSIVGTGADVQEALNDYQSYLNSKGNQVSLTASAKQYDLKGTVKRISQDIANGNTEYYLILNDHTNKIFTGKSSLSNELPITQAGDMVEISFTDSKNEEVNMSSFKNLEFQLQKTTEQISKDAYFAKADSAH